ncbi:MAG: hypothetical protein F6K39_22265 [Okeania sp. SIO3B3]|nr:hypothetical protein [Okeania sp. SIO3B3]
MKQEANIFDWHYQILPSECRNCVGIVQQKYRSDRSDLEKKLHSVKH